MSFEALEIPQMLESPAVLDGRSPREGYQRGAGLKYHGVGQRVSEQADYQEAVALARGRSLLLEMKLQNIYLLIKYYLPKLNPGAIVEFGSYRGGSALFMANLAKKYLPNTEVIGLDTFEGMPPTDMSIDAHHAGDFNDTTFEEVETARMAAGLDNLRFVKGLFEDTFSTAVTTPIALAHIDCDIRSACAFAYDAVKPVMVPGGYIIFDDATECTCLGATEVVESLIISRDGLRSEQIDPHFVFRYPPLKAE